MNQITKQVMVVPMATPKPNQQFEQLALFNIDGDPLVVGMQMPFQADSSAATVEDLVDDFNDLLDKLKTAGLMASS